MSVKVLRLALHPSGVDRIKDQSYWEVNSGALRRTSHVSTALEMLLPLARG